MRAVWKCLLAAFLFLLCSIATFCANWWNGGVTAKNTIAAVIFLILALVSLHISLLQPASSHSFYTMITQYLIYRSMIIRGRFVLGRQLRNSQNVRLVQDNLLRSILKRNSATVYGLRYRFETIGSREEYRRRHPLTRYEQYIEYIERIGAGEDNILTKDKVEGLSLSSGTTGRNKLLPFTHTLKDIVAVCMDPLRYYFADCKAKLSLQRVFIISYRARITRSAGGGLAIGPVSGHVKRTMPFALSPKVAFELTNEQTALHVHAVFGLVEEEVGQMEAHMSTLVHSFWNYVELNWRQLCTEIERGYLGEDSGLDLNLNPAQLRELNSQLRPNRSRAMKLRREFTAGFVGIARRIWRNLRFVRMLTTGGFSHHANALQQRHLTGVKQLSQMHAASEGLFGLNLAVDPDDITYTALIEFGFLEFIPTQGFYEEQPDTYFAEQLEMGKEYELVITNQMGLYRYRMGDVIKVVGFLNQCPIYEFQYRLGQTLNLYWEKTPENVFHRAVKEAAQNLGLNLVDYTATEDLNLDGLEAERKSPNIKHYVLFVELNQPDDQSANGDDQRANGDDQRDNDGAVNDYYRCRSKIRRIPDESQSQNNIQQQSFREDEKRKENKIRYDKLLTKDGTLEFDRKLREIFELYDSLRNSDSIGPMRVISLRHGALARLKAAMIATTQSEQFKMPRVLRNKQFLRLLLEDAENDEIESDAV